MKTSKITLILICILAVVALNLISCERYHLNDYRGYYRDYDHKDHHYHTKPPLDRG